MKIAPPDSVRGRITRFLRRYASGLGTNVIEVGSRLPAKNAWWADNRGLHPTATWTGVDFLEGLGVDVLGDAEKLPFDPNRFTGAVCSETLEHVRRPWVAMSELVRVTQPGGLVLVTTMTAFPIHDYPNDYWRFTSEGLRVLMEDAGLTRVETFSDGNVVFQLNDHGEPGHVRKDCPIHVFGLGYVKE